jgi:hypothetical protein
VQTLVIDPDSAQARQVQGDENVWLPQLRR